MDSNVGKHACSKIGSGSPGKASVQLTWRLSTPILSVSNVSRASSLCPTSSNASVASWPPTSSKTSSPPLFVCREVSRVSNPVHSGHPLSSLGPKGPKAGRARKIEEPGTPRDKTGHLEGPRKIDSRVFVDKFGCIIDYVVNNDVDVRFGVVLGNVLVGKLLGRHFLGCCAGRVQLGR